MEIKKALACGMICAAAALPVGVQLVTPTTASAMQFGSTVIAVAPNSGPASGGTTVTITGQALTVATAVLFGNVPASYTIVSGTEIIATSPAESVGTVVVRVKDGTRLGFGGADFIYS